MRRNVEVATVGEGTTKPLFSIYCLCSPSDKSQIISMTLLGINWIVEHAAM